MPSVSQKWSSLLSTLVGREVFDDDTPISATFDMGWHTHV
jgi:hypothetical protein